MLRFLLMVVLLAGMQSGQAQRNYLKGYFGKSYYYGDLSAGVGKNSGDYTVGAGYSRSVSSYFNVGVDVMRGRLSADDSRSLDHIQRARGLSFFTNYTEVNLHLELNLIKILGGTNSNGVDLLLKLGAGVLDSNPKTIMAGQEYTLRNYHTEGQGLPGQPDMYSRHQVVVPLGFVLRFDLTKDIAVGLDMVVRKTFTDYIDDVSGSYPDLAILAEAYGEKAAQLSCKGGGSHSEPFSHCDHSTRGDASNNDWYSFLGLSLQYMWPTK